MRAKSRTLLNVNLRWFLLAMILANIAGAMAYSMLSLYLIDLGASVGQVGLVFTLASIVPMLLQIFGGWISDTIGCLRAIAISSSFAIFGYLLFFISPSWDNQQKNERACTDSVQALVFILPPASARNPGPRSCRYGRHISSRSLPPAEKSKKRSGHNPASERSV